MNADDTPITLGEVYRAVKQLDERLVAFQVDVKQEIHSLRNKLGVHEVAIALQKAELDRVREQRGWVVGGVTAIGAAAMEYLLHGWRPS